jgi:hypothetical protein
MGAMLLYGIGTAVAGTIGAVTPGSPAYRYAFNARSFRTEQHVFGGLSRTQPTASHPPLKTSPLAYLVSKLRLKLAAATALSITIKSLSCRLRPDAEMFAAPVRSNCPSIWSS